MGREERETLLDEAAAWMASVEGGVSLSALARGTGIPRNRWYQVFSGKEGLLRALREERGVQNARTTRESLLDGLGELLREKELGAIRMEDVAERAGATPMTLYRLFGDRKGLLEAFGKERTPRQWAQHLEWVPGSDPEEVLRSVVERMLRFGWKYRGLFFSAFSRDEETRELFSFLQEQPHTARKALARFFQSLLDAGLIREESADTLVMVLVSQVFGLVLSQRTLTPEELPELASVCVRVFWNGIQSGAKYEESGNE